MSYPIVHQYLCVIYTHIWDLYMGAKTKSVYYSDVILYYYCILQYNCTIQSIQYWVNVIIIVHYITMIQYSDRCVA